jgi:SPP1 gp7 family putative phage head morphogenesis protein
VAVPSRILADIRTRRLFLRLAGRPHRRRGPIPRQVQPDGIRLSYFRALLQVLGQAKALVERATPDLKEIVDRAAAARGDSRLDETDDPNELIDKLSDEFFGEFTNTKLSDLAKGYGQRASDFNRLELGRQFKSALGIDIVKAEPWLEPKIQTFTRENVALIKSIPNRYFDDVEKQVIAGMRQGLRWEEIAKELDRRFEVAEGHAKLVARDQVGKFVGDLNRTRQEELGITSFIWRTARDNRVREEHQALDGQEFTWDKPPAEGIPGFQINCRCQAEPVLKPLIEAVTGTE